MLSAGDDCFSRIEFQGFDGPLGRMEPVAITAAGHRRVTLNRRWPVSALLPQTAVRSNRWLGAVNRPNRS
jgi:hypothetical protein